MTRDERREWWRARVAAFQASGQSRTQWCRAQRIQPHQLDYWLRQLVTAQTPEKKPLQVAAGSRTGISRIQQ